MWFAAAITRLTAAGALAGAIAREPTRRALPTVAVSYSVSPVSVTGTSVSVDSGISAASPDRALTPPGRAFAEAIGTATRNVAATATKVAMKSAALELRAAESATPGANCIHYLLRMPPGLAVGLALKEPALSLVGEFAPKNLVPPLPASLRPGLGIYL